MVYIWAPLAIDGGTEDTHHSKWHIENAMDPVSCSLDMNPPVISILLLSLTLTLTLLIILY